MTITHGSSREHRPDLTQAVLERMVSHDGGRPFVSQRGDGHPSDLEMFQARDQAWLAALPHASDPRDLIADSKLYHADHAPHLRHLGVIIRLPTTMGAMGAVVDALTHALALAGWHHLADYTRDQRLERCHDGMAQRWLVGYSQAAYARAAGTLNNARQRAREAIHTLRDALKQPTRR
jgi:hypothetical protein